MESSLIFELKLLNIDSGCMHGLTHAGYYKFIWVSPWDEFITEINQALFGELWINKGFESKKGVLFAN